MGTLRVFRTSVQAAEAAKKGSHNPDFDKELFAAYEAAAPGKKIADTNAVGAKYNKTAEATQKHLLRVRQHRALMARWCSDN
jgi:hypothetical protein